MTCPEKIICFVIQIHAFDRNINYEKDIFKRNYRKFNFIVAFSL